MQNDTEPVKEKLIKDTLWYTASVYVAQFFGMFSGFATRKFLEPTEMGVWVILQTMLSYGLFAELGILTAMYCRVPVYEGLKDKNKVKETYNAAFTFVFCAAIFAMVIFTLIGFIKPLGHATRIGMFAAGGMVLLTLVYNFYISLLWSWHRFKLLGWTIILNAVLTVFFVFLWVKPWRLSGLYLSALITTAFSIVCIWVNLKVTPKLFFDRRVIFDLLRFGAPIFAAGMIYTIFLSIDRVMIAKLISTEALGLYSIATVVFSFSSTAPKMFSIVLFPRMQEEYASSGSVDRIVSMVIKPDLIIAFLSPVVLGLAYFLIPIMVRKILMKYTAGILAAQILLLGSFFLSLVYNVQNFLITVNKRTHSIPFLILAIGAGLSLIYVFIKRGMGIEGVALAMSFTFFTYFLTLTCYVLRHFLGRREVLIHLIQILFGYAYFIFWVIVIGLWAPVRSEYLSLIFKCLVFLAASLPAVLWADKKTSVLRYGFSTIRIKIKSTAAVGGNG